MKKTIITLALSLAFAAPALFAQTANTATEQTGSTSTRSAKMTQHRVNYLTTVLSLTPAQQTQVTNIISSAAPASHASASSSMKTAHTNLQNAIHSNDAAAMEQAANLLSGLIAQEMLAHAKVEAAIYQVLTPEQQTKMAQLETEHHHGGHGFEGF